MKRTADGPHMGIPALLTFLAVISIASAAAASGGDNQTSSLIESMSRQAPALSLAGFSISEPSPPQGQVVDFTVVIDNTGNVVTTAQAQVYISDSARLLTDSFNYTNITLGSSETITITKAWGTDGRLPGAYTAFANVSYGGIVTNTRFAVFTIGQPYGAAPVVIAPNVSLAVQSQPPPIALPRTDPLLLEYTILKEMSPGDNALIFPLVVNPAADALQVNVTPTGPSAALASAIAVLLPPDKPTSLVIPVQVPQDAPVGYYGLSLVYSLNGSNVSHPLIIRVVPHRTAGLTTYREISIDQHQNNSLVLLNAMNTGTKPVGHGIIMEQVPPGFDLHGISFIAPPTLTDNSLIRWDVANLLPNETRALSYILPGVPSDLRVFTSWHPAETRIIEPNFYRDVSIGGFEAPDIGPGEKGDYVVKLFNAGPSQEAVAVKITGTEGWNVEPDSFSVSIPPRATSDVRFSLTAPADAPDPVYTFTVHLTYGGIEDQKTLPVPINHEKLVTLPQSPLRDQLLAWLVTNAYLLALVAIASVAVSLALHRGYLELRKPRYSKKRVDELTSLRNMFGNGENKG